MSRRTTSLLTRREVIAGGVALAWPPGRQPILIAAYLAEAEASYEDCSAALAEVARGVAEAFA